MATLEVTVDLNKKCVECGKGGAMPSGICLRCTSKALSDKPMRSSAGRAVQERFRRDIAAQRGQSR